MFLDTKNDAHLIYAPSGNIFFFFEESVVVLEK